MNEPGERPPVDLPGSTTAGFENGLPEVRRSNSSRGDGYAAMGVAGLVAFAQSLEDPWRGIASVVGPFTVVVGRWLAGRLETAFHLLEAELVLAVARRVTKNKAQIEALEALVQKFRLRLIELISERVERHTTTQDNSSRRKPKSPREPTAPAQEEAPKKSQQGATEKLAPAETNSEHSDPKPEPEPPPAGE